MAVFYNAVIRDETQKIVAWTHLTDLQNVPWSWKIQYGTKEILLPKDLEGVLCDPSKPLNITRRRKLISDGKRLNGTTEKSKEELNVKFIWKNEISLRVKGSHTVQDLRLMVARKTGALPSIYRLGFEGRLLGKEGDGYTMAELGVCENKNTFMYLTEKEMFEELQKAKSSFKGKPVVTTVKTTTEDSIPSDPFPIYIKTLTGISISFRVSAGCLVEDVKKMVNIKEGIPVDQQRFIYDGKQLEDGRRLHEYGITKDTDTVIHLILRLRGGGGGLPFGNLEGKCKTGKGKRAKPDDYWKGFSQGLNLMGNCENEKCKSKSYAKDSATYHVGYGYVKLTSSTTFKCPACDDYTFKPANFLICGATSAFRFKATVERNVKTKTIGSGPYPEYIKLADGEEKVDYDFIEIFTTRFGSSPHDCSVCGLEICDSEEEMKLANCCHYMHKDCAKCAKVCPMCFTLVVVELEIRIRDLAIMAADADNFM